MFWLFAGILVGILLSRSFRKVAYDLYREWRSDRHYWKETYRQLVDMWTDPMRIYEHPLLHLKNACGVKAVEQIVRLFGERAIGLGWILPPDEFIRRFRPSLWERILFWFRPRKQRVRARNRVYSEVDAALDLHALYKGLQQNATRGYWSADPTHPQVASQQRRELVTRSSRQG